MVLRTYVQTTEHRYNSSEFLQKFIVQARFTDVEWEFTNAEGHKLCYRGFMAQAQEFVVSRSMVKDRNLLS